MIPRSSSPPVPLSAVRRGGTTGQVRGPKGARDMNRTFLTLLTPLVLAACGRGRAATPPAGDAVAVRVAPVSVDRLAPPVTATGTLGPKEEVTLSFKVGGVVSRIFVDEGRAVRAGDTLAELDLSEIDAAVVRARSAAEKAERDLTRARRLYADSVATLEQAQNAQTGRDVAHAELETTLFNRRYAVIVAPASGLILRRSAEPGELVQAGKAILTLGSHARGVVVRAGLADREVVRTRRGDRAVVGFDPFPDRTLAIASGLEGVAAVVTDGAAYLDDSAAVTVRP